MSEHCLLHSQAEKKGMVNKVSNYDPNQKNNLSLDEIEELEQEEKKKAKKEKFNIFNRFNKESEGEQ